MTEEKKRGGARAGAGRPRKEKTVAVSFRVLKESEKVIKEILRLMSSEEKTKMILENGKKDRNI